MRQKEPGKNQNIFWYVHGCMVVMESVNKHSKTPKDDAHQQVISLILNQDQMVTRFPQRNCHQKLGSCTTIVCQKFVKKQYKEVEKK